MSESRDATSSHVPQNWDEMRNLWRVGGLTAIDNALSSSSSSQNTTTTTNTSTTTNDDVTHPITKKKLPTPPVNGQQVLNEFVAGGKFTNRVPLPDLVAILVEIWENEDF